VGLEGGAANTRCNLSERRLSGDSVEKRTVARAKRDAPNAAPASFWSGLADLLQCGKALCQILEVLGGGEEHLDLFPSLIGTSHWRVLAMSRASSYSAAPTRRLTGLCPLRIRDDYLLHPECKVSMGRKFSRLCESRTARLPQWFCVLRCFHGRERSLEIGLDKSYSARI